MVGLVDLDLLSQIPQKDARIIGGERERESFFKVDNGGEREAKNQEEKLVPTKGKRSPF